MIFANVFDMLDGPGGAAHGPGDQVRAFLDSSLDGLSSDMVVFLGIIIFYARDTEYLTALFMWL